jgi:hypothetical protein
MYKHGDGGTSTTIDPSGGFTPSIYDVPYDTNMVVANFECGAVDLLVDV